MHLGWPERCKRFPWYFTSSSLERSHFTLDSYQMHIKRNLPTITWPRVYISCSSPTKCNLMIHTIAWMLNPHLYCICFRYIETEVDCTLALSLDPTYTKAYLRRGTARLALNKVESAVKGNIFNLILINYSITYMVSTLC